MITFIIFIVSGFGIAAILFHKSIELKTGKETFVSKAANYTDAHVLNAHTGVKVAASFFSKESFAKALGWIIANTIVLLRKALVNIQNKVHTYSHSKKIVDMVSGRGDKPNSAGASLFLKRIKGHDKVDKQ